MAKNRDTLSVSRPEFVENRGQWKGDFEFKATIEHGAIFFDSAGYVVTMMDPTSLEDIHLTKMDYQHRTDFSVGMSAYKVSFLQSNRASNYTVFGEKSAHHYNYFLGKSTAWIVGVHGYPSLLRPSLYEGVDLLIFQSGDNLKYEFHIAPYTDPSQISMQYEGVKSLSLVGGCLVIDNYFSRVVELQPWAYQIDDRGDTLTIPCQYVVKNNVVSFKLGAYNAALSLVVDPVVVFSTYSGSTVDNWGYTATYDSQGNLYGGGIAFGVGYPTTLGAFQSNFCDGTGSMLTDVAITKFDSSGSYLYYSTYLGGSYVDIPHSMYVNDNDELYVFGTTGSPDFPVTEQAFDTSFNSGSNVALSTSLRFSLGSDIFVSKFSEDGSQLLASTFVGGMANDGINISVGLRKNYADDNRGEILVDSYSDVYIVSSTFSTDFPVTGGSFGQVHSGGQDVCVFKMNQNLSQMIWSGLIGGTGHEAGYSMMLTEDGGVYICGGTTSTDFPVTYNVLQPLNAGETEGFVAHISANGSQLLQSTYLGRSGYDQAYLIKGDRRYNPHIFGQTDASGSTWIEHAAYSMPGGGQFLLKLTPDLDSVVWSTVFGTGSGGPDISPTALLVDYCNNIYMSGWGSYALNGFGGTSGMPITSDAFQSTTDGSDYYFICLSDDASQLVYGSFFGGDATSAREHVDGGTSRFDRKGRIYQAVCAGCGGQSTFPTTPNVWSSTNGSSNCNLGAIKMDFEMPTVVADFHQPSVVCAPDSVHFENYSQTIGGSTLYFWDFGDGTQSNEMNPTHYYTQSGNYTIRLIVQDNGSCNFADTLVKNLFVMANSTDTLSPKQVCLGDFVQIGLTPSNDVTYSWSPGNTLSSTTLSNPTASPSQTTWYTLIASSAGCVDTLLQKVEVEELQVTLSPDTTICLGEMTTLSVTITPSYSTIEWSSLPDFSQLLTQQTSLTVQPQQTTTYYVRVKGTICEEVQQVTVYVSSVEVDSLPNLLICFEDGVELSATHTGGDGCQYVWTLGDGTTYTEEHPYVTPENSTSYEVTVTNAAGCSGSAVGYIVKRTGTFPEPFEAWCDECEITQAHSTQVFSTDYGEGYLYQWSPTQDMVTPQQASSVVSPMETTIYTVMVTDSFGCTKTDTVEIIVHELTCDDPFIFIPNIFSPNEDGKNDRLYVRSEILERFNFVVYSRWGERVFETTSLEEGWDGTYQGKPCQNGVYDFYFTGTCIGGKSCELKGNVMLVR